VVLTVISNSDWSSQLEFRRYRLGMSKSAVAKRSGVSLPTVERVLSGKEQSPRLANLQAIAETLGVELHVGASITVRETETAQDFRRAQATKKATRLVRMVQGTMSLEAQAVDAETLRGMIDQATSELLAGSPRKL